MNIDKEGLGNFVLTHLDLCSLALFQGKEDSVSQDRKQGRDLPKAMGFSSVNVYMAVELTYHLWIVQIEIHGLSWLSTESHGDFFPQKWGTSSTGLIEK